MKWLTNLHLIDKIATGIGALQRNRYLKSVQQGLEFSIPLLLVLSISILFLNFPSISYQIWLRTHFNIVDSNVHYLINAIWVIICINFVMGISYIFAETFNNSPLVGMSRYQSFLSVLVSVSAYMIVAITNRDLLYISYGGGLQRFPAEILIAILVALSSTRLFIFFSSIREKQRNLYSDMSNPVLSRVYAALMPAILTLTIFIVIRLVRVYLDVTFIYDVFDRLYAHLHNRVLPATLGEALHYVFLENIYWLFGIDSTLILSDMNGNYIVLSNLLGYDLFDMDSKKFVFSRAFFSHFVYLGGEGALLSLVFAYWWVRVRTDYDRTIQLATVPVLFNINKLLLYGLPIIANPVFIIPFLLTPIIFTITSYCAFSLGLVPPINRTLSWYTPVILSGYQSTGSVSGIFLQIFNLFLGTMIYAPFLILSRKIRDHEYNQGHKELIDFSINRYVSEENYLNVRTDAVGAAARILSSDLRVALRTGELYLVYQPKINFIEGKVLGVEALIRWKHPSYGYIPPPVIVSIAEENELLNELSHWVITESLSQVAQWQRQGLKDVHVGVNLSAREINNPYLADFILNTLKFFNIKPSQLEIEIVETIELSVNDMVKTQLNRLVEQGISLAIDDFGVGHGSAIYLKNFAINTLKVDKAISEEAYRDERIAAIFNGVMYICNDLHVDMVIEHVETEEQLEYLVRQGGTIFQGYLFSKPLSADDLYEYMVSVEKDRSLLTKSLDAEKLQNVIEQAPKYTKTSIKSE